MIYKILQKDSRYLMEEEINKLAKDGWEVVTMNVDQAYHFHCLLRKDFTVN
jgi:hypothetical protein